MFIIILFFSPDLPASGDSPGSLLGRSRGSGRREEAGLLIARNLARCEPSDRKLDLMARESVRRLVAEWILHLENLLPRSITGRSQAMGFQSTTCFIFSRATTPPSASTTSRRTKPLISGSARLLEEIRWREASAPMPTSYRGAMFSLGSSQRHASISTPSSKASSIPNKNWRPYVNTDSEKRRKEEARPDSKKPRFFFPPARASLIFWFPASHFFLFFFVSQI